jgi:hypothetical protein
MILTITGVTYENRLGSLCGYPIITTPTPAPAYSFGTRNNETSGAFSTICGEALSAETRDQFACGRYNNDNSNYALMVGNGDETNGYSNAFAVTWDGDLLMALDEDAATGTDDAALYDALADLGWESEVVDGLGIKRLLTKILKRITFKPTQLYNARTETTKVGTDWEYHTHAFLADWDVIAVRFIVHEHMEVFYIVRGDTLERGLTDWPDAGKFRGTLYVDWDNNRIGIRAISAGSSGSYYNLIYYSTIYGIVPH